MRASALSKILATGLVMISFSVPTQARKTMPESPKPTASFPLAEVIAQVKRELTAAQNTPGASVGLKLDSVDLNFSLVRATNTNGKVSVGIPVVGGVELGGSGDNKAESTSSLLVSLVPPEPTGTMSAADSSNFGITQAIVDTRRELAEGLNDSPKLEPKKVVITLKFAVTRSKGGAGQIRFLVFTLGGGHSLTSANSSSITLTFSKAGL